MCASCVLTPSRLNRNDREDAGYASLELPGEATLSLATLDIEETSDDLISPYASFSSTADRPTPLLSGWLDKLSPQGLVPGQRRGQGFGGDGWGGSSRSYKPVGTAFITSLTWFLPGPSQKLRLPEALCAVQREKFDVLWQ